MKIFTETENLKLEFEHETSFLIENKTGRILFEEDFYGNPKCGIIDPENNWAIIAGIHLTLWKPDKVRKFENENFKWIHSLRIKNLNIVEILIDPWSEISAIWELNIETNELSKIKNFTKYFDKEYSESVKW